MTTEELIKLLARSKAYIKAYNIKRIAELRAELDAIPKYKPVPQELINELGTLLDEEHVVQQYEELQVIDTLKKRNPPLTK